MMMVDICHEQFHCFFPLPLVKVMRCLKGQCYNLGR